MKEVGEVRNWATLREEVIRSFTDKSQYQLNPEGRLLIVSDYKLSNSETIINENDCLQISFKDATDLILNPNSKDLSGFKTAVEDWGLSLSPLSDIQVKSKVPPIVEKTDDSDQPNSNETVSQPKITKGKDPEIENDVINEEDLGNGIYFPVGEQKGAIKSVTNYFHPSNTNLNQLNIGVVGDLGTGKTQLIKALIYNISKDEAKNRGKSPKFFIMDTKRDYDGIGDKDSDKKFVTDIKAKVVKPNILPINLFDIRNSIDDDPAYTKADFFIDILKKIFGGIGPKQEDGLLEAVMNCFEARGYEAFKGDYSDFVSPTLKDVFEEYKESIGDKKDAPYSLMNKLIRARLFEEDSSKTIGFSEFFDQTVVLSLGGIASNDRNLKMVMIIFMNLFREYMLGVKKSPFIKRDGFQLRQIDSYLLIDEANLVMEYELPVLEDLLLKGREFGIGILLSSQYMSHFKKSGTNYMEPLLTWFVHKVPNVTIRELSALGLSNIDDQIVNKIKNLECHYCLYKSLNAPGNFIEGICIPSAKSELIRVKL
jgi:DNA phosphorothioation-dependent restriction protein DptH